VSHPNAKSARDGGIGFAASVILVWLMTLFGLEVPAEVAAAIAALLTAVMARIAAPARS